MPYYQNKNVENMAACTQIHRICVCTTVNRYDDVDDDDDDVNIVARFYEKTISIQAMRKNEIDILVQS